MAGDPQARIRRVAGGARRARRITCATSRRREPAGARATSAEQDRRAQRRDRRGEEPSPAIGMRVADVISRRPAHDRPARGGERPPTAIWIPAADSMLDARLARWTAQPTIASPPLGAQRARARAGARRAHGEQHATPRPCSTTARRSTPARATRQPALVTEQPIAKRICTPGSATRSSLSSSIICPRACERSLTAPWGDRRRSRAAPARRSSRRRA